MKLFVLGWLAAVTQSIKLSEWGDCTYAFEDELNDVIFVHYNLTLFHLSNEAFEVDDAYDRDWKYEFNICGTIPDSVFSDTSIVPTDCYTNYTSFPCVNRFDNGSCAQYFDTTDQLPLALQIEVASDTDTEGVACQWLGADIGDGNKPYSISLYDENNAAKGVVYTIPNGAWCPEGNTNRELVVELVCPDSPRYTFDPAEEASISEPIYEHPTCVFTVTYESPLACPSQCIVQRNSEYSVCSGKGICVSDPFAPGVRCICDSGYGGDKCDSIYSEVKVVTQAHTGLVVCIILSVIVLAVVVILSVYLCHKIRQEQAKHGEDMLGMGFQTPMLREQAPPVAPKPHRPVETNEEQMDQQL